MNKEEILKAIDVGLYVDYGKVDIVEIEVNELATFIENLFLKQKLNQLETK